MSIRLLALVALSFLSSVAHGRIIISGYIVDESNEPVDAVTTKLVDRDGKMLIFQMTDENGFFKYALDRNKIEIDLIIESLGFEPVKQYVSTDKDLTNLKIRLKIKSTLLKEVVVGAPSVTLRGDTVSYRLAAFTGKGDISLKDAMRNLPGIDITENGKIKYLGKDISNFYIEGMDLLGGKYNVATDNLSVAAVSNVEILNNHQSVNMDKDVFSDNVAINIKLSTKAKFKPIGSSEAKVGYSDRWLHEVSGAGMMFNNKFQSILNAKYGNIAEFADNANTDHSASYVTTYSATELLGKLGHSTPPLDRNRFINTWDAFISLNTLTRTGEDAAFRANVDYSHIRNNYKCLSIRDYRSEDGIMRFNQDEISTTSIHRPSLTMEYKLNSKNRYLTNTLTGNIGIRDNDLLTISNGQSFVQNQNVRDYLIHNNFSSNWRNLGLRWNLSSVIEYGATPWGKVEISDTDSQQSFVQSADSRFFLTKETLTSFYDFKDSRIWMPLSVLYSNNHINSLLNNPVANNAVVGDNIRMWFAPQYEYTNPMRKYVVRASANFKWDYNNIVNNGSRAVKTSISKFSINPYLYCNCSPTPFMALRTQISYLTGIGDFADFMTAPIRIDQLSISYKTGILSESRSFNAILHYDFKLPLDMWFINADVIYDNTRSNIMSNSNITSAAIETSLIPYLNNTESVTGMFNLAKMITAINTKISLGAVYMWGRTPISQNSILSTQYGSSYSLFAKVITKPWQFLEFNYDGTLSSNHIRYNSGANTLMSQSHNLWLNIFPFKGFQIKMGADLLWKELAENSSKSMNLMNCGVSYKFSHYRLGLDVSNILNTRHYSYTVFSNINQFSYDYALRGREIVISLSFMR